MLTFYGFRVSSIFIVDQYNEWRGTKMEDGEDTNVSISRKSFKFTRFRNKFKIQTYLENANVGEMVSQLMCEMGHVIGTVFGASTMVLQLMHAH